MPEIDVMQYIRWAREAPSRSVKIEYDRGELLVWVYDRQLGAGMYAVSHSRLVPADQIDIKAHKEENERKRYEALKEKFEGGN